MKKLGLIATLAMLACSIVGCGQKTQAPSEPEPVEPEIVYTAESVAADMNANFAAAGYSLTVDFDEDYNEYGLAVSFGAAEDESEETLYAAAYTLASFLPDYLELAMQFYDDPASEDFYDVFGVGIATYVIAAITPDESVEADVISYNYGGTLIAQVSIYDLGEAEAE